MKRSYSWTILLAWTWAFLMMPAAPSASGAPPLAATMPAASHTLRVFEQRLAAAAADLGPVVQAAQAAAKRVAANPKALIHVPYDIQSGFADELINRAGGLANTLPPEQRAKDATSSDIALLSVRSWREDGPKLKPVLESLQAQGALIVLFASRADMPADLKVDHLIDNHAARGGGDEAADNAIANSLHAWLWVCEYAAALTREGKYPGVLLSILLPSATEFDARLQRGQGRTFVGSCDQAIAAGQLARTYLGAVESLAQSLHGSKTRGQIDQAADLVVDQLRAGRRVLASTNTHILSGELFATPRTPIVSFKTIGNVQGNLLGNLRQGDVMIWMGYLGMNTVYDDYAKPIRQSGARLISCYARSGNEAENAHDAQAHIDQNWNSPDAVVEVPFPPGRIGPISGLNQVLLYRMLEDAVLERLERQPLTAPSTTRAGEGK